MYANAAGNQPASTVTPYRYTPPTARRNDAATADDGAVIEIFDEISNWWGFGLQNMAYDMLGLGNQALTVRVNSVGGDAMEALAVASMLKQYPGKVTTIGMGLVASAATFILLAGGSVKMARHSFLMIHNASGSAYGKKEEIANYADTIAKLDATMADLYFEAIQKRGKATKAAQTMADIRGWMDAETWFTAEEALSHGFIDEIIDETAVPETTVTANIAAWQTSIQNNACLRNTPAAIQAIFKSNSTDMSIKKPAGLWDKLKALLAEAEETTEATTVETVATTEPDPLAAARALLAENGFLVTEAPAEVVTEAATAKVKAPAVVAAAKPAEAFDRTALMAEIKAMIDGAAKPEAEDAETVQVAGRPRIAAAASTTVSPGEAKRQAIRAKQIAQFTNLAAEFAL